MDEPEQERQYGTLRCTDCGHEFPGRLPPFCSELPECPMCWSGPVQLVELVEPVAG
jgi:hypothetical protein